MDRIIESISRVFAEIGCEKNLLDLWNHIFSSLRKMDPSASRRCKATKVNGRQQKFSFLSSLYGVLMEKEKKYSQTNEQDRR
jgi:hypothetical protein